MGRARAFMGVGGLTTRLDKSKIFMGCNSIIPKGTYFEEHLRESFVEGEWGIRGRVRVDVSSKCCLGTSGAAPAQQFSSGHLQERAIVQISKPLNKNVFEKVFCTFVET